jgi:hypothetical protein
MDPRTSDTLMAIFVVPVYMVKMVCPPCLFFLMVTGIFTIQAIIALFDFETGKDLYPRLIPNEHLRLALSITRLVSWVIALGLWLNYIVTY